MSADATPELVSGDEADTRLDRWIKRRVQISQGRLEKLLREGRIRVDGAKATSNQRLAAGQAVLLPGDLDELRRPADPPDAASGVPPADAAFIRSLVIHEDRDLIALNKPPGLAVQGGTKQGRHIDGMLAALAEAGGPKPRLVHRLDRDTSGVLVLAKSAGAAARLGKLFKSRDLAKVYWAVTVGVPNPRAGQLRGWMVKGAGPGEDREKMRPSAQNEPGARHAITDYATLSQAGQKAAWVALRPQTGRTHQLRFHMQELGSAILGDRKYPTRREVPLGVASGLHLHARALILPRERGRPLVLQADLPGHMRQTFDTLGFLLEEAGSDPLEPFA